MRRIEAELSTLVHGVGKATFEIIAWFGAPMMVLIGLVSVALVDGMPDWYIFFAMMTFVIGVPLLVYGFLVSNERMDTIIQASISTLEPMTPPELEQLPRQLAIVDLSNPNRTVYVDVDEIPDKDFLEYIWNASEIPTEDEIAQRFPGESWDSWVTTLVNIGRITGRASHGVKGERVGTLESLFRDLGYLPTPALHL
jgi:hypothetical protein